MTNFYRKSDSPFDNKMIHGHVRLCAYAQETNMYKSMYVYKYFQRV